MECNMGSDWLVVCVLRTIRSEVIKKRHPHLMSLAKDMELGLNTVPTGNRTPGCRVAVHYISPEGYMALGCLLAQT